MRNIYVRLYRLPIFTNWRIREGERGVIQNHCGYITLNSLHHIMVQILSLFLTRLLGHTVCPRSRMLGKRSFKSKKNWEVGWMGECLYMNWNLCFSSSVSYRKDIEWSEYACLMEKASFYVQVLFLLLCLIFYWCWRKERIVFSCRQVKGYIRTEHIKHKAKGMRIRGCCAIGRPGYNVSLSFEA